MNLVQTYDNEQVMEEGLKMMCGLVGLLIGAGLLTYLTSGADHTPGRFRKRRQKKRSFGSEAALLAEEDKSTTEEKKHYASNGLKKN